LFRTTQASISDGKTMANFRITASQPPLVGDAIVETVVLADGQKVIGQATWFTSGTDGHASVLQVSVDPNFGRQGHGAAIVKKVIQRAKGHFESRGGRLRRVTINAEQKSQVVGRAFLTKLGFHHVGTLSNVLVKQDLMVYSLGCD